MISIHDVLTVGDVLSIWIGNEVDRKRSEDKVNDQEAESKLH
jgi:hypothetical protein